MVSGSLAVGLGFLSFTACGLTPSDSGTIKGQRQIGNILGEEK